MIPPGKSQRAVTTPQLWTEGYFYLTFHFPRGSFSFLYENFCTGVYCQVACENLTISSCPSTSRTCCAMDKYTFPCEPVANPDSVVQGPTYRFTLLSDTVLRYEWSEDGNFEDRASAFAINRNFPAPEFTVSDTKHQLEIRSRNFHITYDKKRFSRSGFIIGFASKVTLWGADWHFGETAKDNLGGTARTLDEVDGRCDVGEGILSRSGYSTLDDSDTMMFDGQGFVAPRQPGDRIDGYMFCYGHDFKGAMKSFYAISGQQPTLPRWALGNWWSRYYPYSADDYLRLMDKFRKQDVPLSVAVIDMDWHEVKGDHIPHAGWTGYTWDKELIPNPTAFGEELHSRGLKITLNDHPHAGVHHHEELYETMAKALDHDTSKKAPILFDPTNPQFMDVYLSVLHRNLEKQACDFWWIDWQQGPISRVPGLDPLWLLNYFHFQDHANQHGDGNAIIFSRYAGPGSHRYPVGFSGDSVISWDSLKFQPEFTATASNIGYGWWSHDIGGHMQGFRDDEMATRWVQFGVFSPIFRLHSSHSRWTSKEPWEFRAEHCAAMKSFMQLRHRLVPYLYTMNATGGDEPIVQPLYWKFPERHEAYEKPNEYYFGSNLVVAPVVEPRNPRTNLARTDVWVPPGRHVDLFNGLVYEGDRQISMYRPLESIPVLAPAGAIIPLDREASPDNGCKNPTAYEVLVVVGQDGEFTILEDKHDDINSENASTSNGVASTQRRIGIDYKQSTGKLRVAASEKDWTFKFVGVTTVPQRLKVSVAGNKVDAAVSVESKPGLPGLAVRVPKATSATDEIIIELGERPQLSEVDVVDRAEELLLDAQMEFRLKDLVLECLDSTRGPVSKMAELLSLGLEEAVLGALSELVACQG